MTTEEKARAYDEALNKIKPLYEQAKRDGNPIWSTYEYLFPQLAESEDEKARKWIYDFIRNCPNETFEFYGGVGKKAVLAYLEKQKEPHYTKRNALFDKCVENCDPEIMQRVSDEVDEMLQKEQKPAGWSEEDELMMKAVIGILDESDHPKLCHWLKSLKPQPKQEWSEEDEEIFNNIIEKAKGGHWIEVNEITWLITHFKSLRPQPKAELTLLDKNIIEAAVAFVEQNNHFNYWGGIEKCTVIKALHSLKPSWKPSEEQMNALKNSAYGSYQNGDGPALRELYEQLKKLM